MSSVAGRAKKDYEQYLSPKFGMDKMVWKEMESFLRLVKFRGSWNGQLDDLLLAPQVVTSILKSNLKYVARNSFEDQRVLFSTDVEVSPGGASAVRVSAHFKKEGCGYSFGYLISGVSGEYTLQLYVRANTKTPRDLEKRVPISCELDSHQTMGVLRKLFRQLRKERKQTLTRAA